MITEKIALAEKFPVLAGLGSSAVLYTYVRGSSEEISPSRTWPAMLVCPGGGYCMTSDREAEPVALEFAARGFQCFVLRYTCAPARYPLALQEAAAAMAYIHQESARYCVDTSRIAVMGFSAGGHLAASLSLFWDAPEVCGPLSLQAAQTRPDALCLGYPVITSGTYAHRGSFENLLGEKSSAELLHRLSLENSVRPDMPPVFLWHTADDDCVPVENSLFFALALRKAEVPFELHIYPHGSHGLSLSTMQTQVRDRSIPLLVPEVAGWTALCSAWLARTLPGGTDPKD
ncbi:MULTISPECIES: alpha/beta hydrolase [Caproicibacterium]|uniref:Alpha/beta hydrolase n=1 Tax=Caproicibacterium argilliputei TaxID=3030016 RepID=A0AA97D840_9FIRM|nr:alpha/beta hydrolase [Caproicibacterium argilliputei]WOC31419.1 alpha/beta hydrolase [Caproicibacterium argilliputei]